MGLLLPLPTLTTAVGPDISPALPGELLQLSDKTTSLGAGTGSFTAATDFLGAASVSLCAATVSLGAG